jgi:hypothetical protein
MAIARARSLLLRFAQNMVQARAITLSTTDAFIDKNLFAPSSFKCVHLKVKVLILRADSGIFS